MEAPRGRFTEKGRMGGRGEEMKVWAFVTHQKVPQGLGGRFLRNAKIYLMNLQNMNNILICTQNYWARNYYLLWVA